MKVILLIADSRGRRLENQLKRINNDQVHYLTMVKSGAGLMKLWSTAKMELSRRKIDVLFIYGGICDITNLYYDAFGNRSAWPPDDIESRVNSVCAMMDEIAADFMSLESYTSLSFIMEAGMDLLVYNSIQSPIPRRLLDIQEKLEVALLSLQEKVKMLNRFIGSETAWSLDATHSRRGGQMVPVYSRLPDGLHPNDAVARRLARAIASAAEKMISTKKTRVSPQRGDSDSTGHTR